MMLKWVSPWSKGKMGGGGGQRHATLVFFFSWNCSVFVARFIPVPCCYFLVVIFFWFLFTLFYFATLFFFVRVLCLPFPIFALVSISVLSAVSAFLFCFVFRLPVLFVWIVFPCVYFLFIGGRQPPHRDPLSLSSPRFFPLPSLISPLPGTADQFSSTSGLRLKARFFFLTQHLHAFSACCVGSWVISAPAVAPPSIYASQGAPRPAGTPPLPPINSPLGTTAFGEGKPLEDGC